jgi:glycosyltransferase involved in cell wall biosynthesis
MSRLKILHITNWYPSDHSPKTATWIKKQIDSLPGDTLNIIYHIEVIKKRFRITGGINRDKSNYIIFYFPFEIWRIYEWISFLIVVWVIFKQRKQHLDIINFHIAYPNCTYVSLLTRLIRIPVVISEHWSAYHYQFNVKNPDKLIRIKKIFHHNIPVICVSNVLAEDIRKFSKAKSPFHIVPNVVDTHTFRYIDSIAKNNADTFFMISNWKWPKNPFFVIRSFEKILDKNPNIKLRIGGYGPQWNDMIKLSAGLQIDQKIDFLGFLSPKEVAEEMNHATALIHCSEYETFSVVCAESICCGTPVIASDVGGIKDLITDQNGLLIENSITELLQAVNHMIKNKNQFERQAISDSASRKFNQTVVGEQYLRVLQQCL